MRDYSVGVAQVTWRATDELVERVRRAAKARQSSLNEYVTAVLDAATDPGTAGSEAEALRERLDRAGLLAPTSPRSNRPRPPPSSPRLEPGPGGAPRYRTWSPTGDDRLRRLFCIGQTLCRRN
jgi:hypothetical protein